MIQGDSGFAARCRHAQPLGAATSDDTVQGEGSFRAGAISRVVVCVDQDNTLWFISLVDNVLRVLRRAIVQSYYAISTSDSQSAEIATVPRTLDAIALPPVEESLTKVLVVGHPLGLRSCVTLINGTLVIEKTVNSETQSVKSFIDRLDGGAESGVHLKV